METFTSADASEGGEASDHAALRTLSPAPPFVWPETRCLAGLADYTSIPPFESIVRNSDRLAAVLIDVSDTGIAWLRKLFLEKPARKCCLVFLVYPSCPTREKHMRALRAMLDELKTDEVTLEFRVLPVQEAFGPDCRKATFPPTTFCCLDSNSDAAHFAVGSVGNAGCDEWHPFSMNFVFKADVLALDSWRQWFDLLFLRAAPFDDASMVIPSLVPAPGQREAHEAWLAYEDACVKQRETAAKPEPAVDPNTGEVSAPATAAGEATRSPSAALAIPKPSPVWRRICEIYQLGRLATVDDTSRIKPLDVPVKAALLGGRSVTTVGRVSRKESFSLLVLDEAVAKQIEACRQVADVLELLSFQLSKGVRWIPSLAVPLLERELARRNTEGKAILLREIGGDMNSVIAKREGALITDLNKMYKELGRGEHVPDQTIREIFEEVRRRFRRALDGRITPQVSFGELAPPLLKNTGSASPWAQPLSLLLSAARLLRKPFADAFFMRNFKGLSFTLEEFLKTMNILGDSGPERFGKVGIHQAATELAFLEHVETAICTAELKCAVILELFAGKSLDELEVLLKGEPSP